MKILAIGAHYDDIELGCGGSLSRWKKEGHEIHYFVASESGYSTPEGQVIRSSEIARKEGHKAAAMMNACLTEGLIPSFEVEFVESLNAILLKLLKEIKPDIMLTHWHGDVHHDHRALARASIHCSKHVPRLLMYSSNWYESEVRFNPMFFVDITRYLDEKVKLIQVYESEITRTHGRWLDFVVSQARLNGLKAETKYAEGFEALKWLY
jgi:LmbE family N-acetylglucosaminyl deacetylase